MFVRCFTLFVLAQTDTIESVMLDLVAEQIVLSTGVAGPTGPKLALKGDSEFRNSMACSGKPGCRHLTRAWMRGAQCDDQVRVRHRLIGAFGVLMLIVHVENSDVIGCKASRHVAACGDVADCSAYVYINRLDQRANALQPIYADDSDFASELTREVCSMRVAPNTSRTLVHLLDINAHGATIDRQRHLRATRLLRHAPDRHEYVELEVVLQASDAFDGDCDHAVWFQDSRSCSAYSGGLARLVWPVRCRTAGSSFFRRTSPNASER